MDSAQQNDHQLRKKESIIKLSINQCNCYDDPDLTDELRLEVLKQPNEETIYMHGGFDAQYAGDLQANLLCLVTLKKNNQKLKIKFLLYAIEGSKQIGIVPSS